MVLWVVISANHSPPHCKNNSGGVPPTGMESINYGLLSVDYHLAFMYLNTNKNQKY